MQNISVQDLECKRGNPNSPLSSIVVSDVVEYSRFDEHHSEPLMDIQTEGFTASRDPGRNIFFNIDGYKDRATLIGDKWILEPIQTPHQNPSPNASWSIFDQRGVGAPPQPQPPSAPLAEPSAPLWVEAEHFLGTSSHVNANKHDVLGLGTAPQLEGGKKKTKSKSKSKKCDNKNKKTQKKYKSRPSPAFPANVCKNKTKKGNNGKFFKSVSDKNGLYKWVAVKKK
jgi:hypothetical protein